MVSLMNGLSSLGAGVSTFAGQAGLELQKSQLADQQAVLADQLATTRETALQKSAGDIAAAQEQKRETFETGLQGQQQTFQAGQTAATLAAEAARTKVSEDAATGRTAMSEAAATTRQAALIEAERQKAILAASLPTPEEREVRAYTGGAVPGTPEYQKGVRDLALVKAGIDPNLYSTTPASGAGAAPQSGAATPAPGAGGTQGSAVPAPAVGSASYKPAAPGLDSGAPPGGYNEAVLAGKPAWLVAKVHALNEGREEPPSSRSLTDPKSPEFVANTLLLQYNPNFDATLYPTRLEAQKAIAPGGSLFTSVSAMNTSMGHVDHLNGLYDELGNYRGGTLVNAPLNTVLATTGHYPVINEIKQTVNAMAEEGNRIYAGNAGTQTAIDAWKDTFPLNGSIAEQKAALKNFTQLMGAKFETLASQVNAAAGYPGKAPVELLTPAARDTYLKWTAPAANGSAAASSSSPAIPAWVKPGDQYSAARGQARGPDGKTYGPPQ